MQTKIKTSRLVSSTVITFKKLDAINRERGLLIKMYYQVREPATDQDIVKSDQPVGELWQYIVRNTYNGVPDPNDNIIIGSGFTAHEVRRNLGSTIALLCMNEIVIFEKEIYL